MLEEIINYPFDEIGDDDTMNSENFHRSSEEVFIDRQISDAELTHVNGHNLPEDDEEDEDDEDDLVLGDEDELDEDEIDVELEEDADEVSDDDLVLGDDEDEDEEDDL